MNLLRFLSLLLFLTPLANHAADVRNGASSPEKPDELARSIYNEVVTLHPLGVPGGAAYRVFKPYLSRSLRDKIDLNIACQDDWARKHPDPASKPPFLEFGMFSGDDLRAAPSSFQIEKVEPQKGGAIRVYINLRREEPGEDAWAWQVALVLVQEAAHLVVDDVIYLQPDPQHGDVRLSKYLSQGCEGAHWVGSRE